MYKVVILNCNGYSERKTIESSTLHGIAKDLGAEENQGVRSGKPTASRARERGEKWAGEGYKGQS